MQSLAHDGALDRQAIESCSASADDLRTALSAGGEAVQLAALAIIAGERGLDATTQALMPLLAEEDLAGRAAAWALGRLGNEQELLTAAENGKLDERENAYRALAALAANGRASPDLADAMRRRVESELERAQAGQTSLAEHATRVLAVLGNEDAVALIQRVIEEDRFTDRFELQRQRKQLEADGRDQESIRELSGPWHDYFADDLAGAEAAGATEPSPSAELTVDPGGPSAARAAPETAAAPTPPPPPSPQPDDAGHQAPAAGDAEDGAAGDEEGGEEPAGPPIDWPGFTASPEHQALDPTEQQLIAQLGPMLEQLTAQVAGVTLTTLRGQELAGLLLQVLPQVLGQQSPQMLSAALSPQALNAYQALARFLARTDGAEHGDELIDGVKLVREQMREQMRSSGMLGGPDYSDPDEQAPDDGEQGDEA